MLVLHTQYCLMKGCHGNVSDVLKTNWHKTQTLPSNSRAACASEFISVGCESLIAQPRRAAIGSGTAPYTTMGPFNHLTTSAAKQQEPDVALLLLQHVLRRTSCHIHITSNFCKTNVGILVLKTERAYLMSLMLQDEIILGKTG